MIEEGVWKCTCGCNTHVKHIAKVQCRSSIMSIHKVLIFQNWKFSKPCCHLRHSVISSPVIEAVYKLNIGPCLLLSPLYSQNT